MARPAIAVIKLSDTLSLAECHPTSTHRGPYWLYDKTRGMNLSMGAATPEAAFVEALTYYQDRLATVEADYAALQSKVDSFLSQFQNESETEETDA